jgi:prevent-host-death family protein
METIGMFEAKTHLPEIIRKVQNGQEYCLTNRNKAVAFIIPVEQYYQHKNQDILAQFNELKKRAPLGNASEIINMRDEGRK